MWDGGNSGVSVGSSLLPYLITLPTFSKEVGTKLSEWLKALRPSSTDATYGLYRVSNLPDDVTAGGMRVGAANTMALVLPVEKVAAMTGHDLTSLSALFEYLGITAIQCVAGARVLAGWPAPPWGEPGPCPVPASLDALAGVLPNLAVLEPIMDRLFNLHPGLVHAGLLAAAPAVAATATRLAAAARLEGAMRPFVRAMLAAQVRQAAGVRTGERAGGWGGGPHRTRTYSPSFFLERLLPTRARPSSCSSCTTTTAGLRASSRSSSRQ